MSLTTETMLAVIKSKPMEGYADKLAKYIIPTLAQQGLAFAAPFVSPIIIAAASNLIEKGLKLTGDKIEIAYDKLEEYKEDKGIKGFLARMASPCLGVLKKIFPVSEREIYEGVLSGDPKLEQFFDKILNDPGKRRIFEQELRKLLTGDYTGFEEFKENIKDTLGIITDSRAIEAYTQFAAIIYDSEILNTIIDISGSTKDIKRTIEAEFTNLHEDFLTKYNEIKNEFVEICNEFYQQQGLDRVTPYYFESYTRTDKDFGRWRDGFAFSILTSIKEGKEFRRDWLIEEIKTKLEKQLSLLLVGGSGTSKTTLLMELICDYYEKEKYEILWNRGDTSIEHAITIIKYIEKLLDKDNSVLVAVDNVQDEERSAIFYIMDQLLLHKKSANLRFILTARLPEYTFFVDTDRPRYFKLGEKSHKEAIKKFNNNSDFTLEVPLFVQSDVKGFIKKYQGQKFSNEEELEKEAREVFSETNGHPIMVKFSVFGEGLRSDVEDRFHDYLDNSQTNPVDRAKKIRTMIACSLLDVSNVQINDTLLKDMKLNKYAMSLKHALLYRSSEGIWKTIHPRWDLEFISFLYSEKATQDEDLMEENKNYLKEAVKSILDLKHEKMASSVIQTLYNIPIRTDMDRVSIDIIEDIMPAQLPEYLSNETASFLYGFVMAYSYYETKRYPDALDKCDKALALYEGFSEIWYNKGIALVSLGKYQDSLSNFDRATHINPNFINAWHNKGLALNKLGKHELAITCYDRIIQLDKNNAAAWNNKAMSLKALGKYDEARPCFDIAFKLSFNL